MWFWKKGRRTPKIAPETLEERLDALEGSFRGLKAEWLDTYDKLYRLAGRLDAGRRWGAEKTASPPTGSPAIDVQAPTEEQSAPAAETPKDGHPRTRHELMATMV